MDQSKAAPGRKRRASWAPALESLEGRRLCAAGPKIGIGEGPSNGVQTLIITGTPRSDVIDIYDDGSADAGNITVQFGDGSVYTSKSPIAQIEVATAGGNDRVTYNLTGNLDAERTVLIDLGNGNDRYTGNLSGAIANPAGLDLEVYGEAGNDTMTDNQYGPVLQGALIPFLDGGTGNDRLTFNGSGLVNGTATLNPAISGDAGNDVITSTYSGTIFGKEIYNLTVNGGPGNDTINDTINVGPNSVGDIGSSSSTPALVEGGPGNDTIEFGISVDPNANPTGINAMVIGGPGRDNIKRTSNVAGDPSNESDAMMS